MMINEKIISKRVYILLQNGHQYNGHVINVDDDFIEIRDKMNDIVFISRIFISSLVVKND